MAEDSATARQRLLPAREELVRDLVEGLPARVPLSVVTGETGSGRSAVLDATARDLSSEDVRVLRLRVGEGDRASPYGALYRLLVELEQDGGQSATERASVLGLVAKLGADAAGGELPAEETAARLVTSVFAVLRRYAPAVLLVDDAQRLDDATARLVEQLVRQCAGAGCSIVATWRGGGPDGSHAHGYAASLHRLFAAGLARTVVVRPLARAESAALIAHEIAAVPDDDLVARFHHLTRGNLSALRAAIGDARARGALRVVDQHAYLGQSTEPPSLPEEHPLVAHLRDFPPFRRRVVSAMAVLCGVGTTAAPLVAEVLGVDESEVVAEVEALVADRVLVRRPGRGWRFRKPMALEGMRSWLGPYERRRLCAHGAEALWEGRAHVDDENLLPDLLVGAGGLVDQERSAKELLSGGTRLMFTDTARAVRWLRAAVRRTRDERERANAMMVHASACAVGDRMAEAVTGSRDLLRRHSSELSPEMLQQMEIVYATGLAACEQWDELERLADWTHSPWSARQPAHEMITRAFALVLLGRWVEGQRLLQQWWNVWSTANSVSANFGHMFLGGAGVLLGDPSTIRRLFAEPEWPAGELPQFAFEHTRHEVDMLLVLGELRPALQRLQARSTGVEQLHGPDRFLVQWYSGDHSTALETARRSMAEGEGSARVLASVVMSFGAARLLAARGWVSRAQRMAEVGRGPQLGHVLDHVQSSISRFLGADEEADELLRGGLRRAEEHGHVLGTEHMWADLARRERELGAWDSAQECVRRTEELAGRFGTGHAELVHLVARAEVFEDAGAGRAAVELARERAMPYECATTFRRVALSGVDTAELLLEAYEVFGQLDALLWRAHLRTVLRANDITVPGRSTATRENERLLAVLVSEGLSNRQVATVFSTSEKSVEGRLTRMFAKSGYRSRVELAAALLRGDFHG